MKKQLTMKSKLRQRNLFVDERSLFEKLCDPVKLRAGFKAVKKNGGSPGIDGVTIKEFDSRLEEELAQLQMELESWYYEPKPVRRVDPPKPGKGAGVRLCSQMEGKSSDIYHFSVRQKKRSAGIFTDCYVENHEVSGTSCLVLPKNTICCPHDYKSDTFY